jgi:hypothetical protein
MKVKKNIPQVMQNFLVRVLVCTKTQFLYYILGASALSIVLAPCAIAQSSTQRSITPVSTKSPSVSASTSPVIHHVAATVVNRLPAQKPANQVHVARSEANHVIASKGPQAEKASPARVVAAASPVPVVNPLVPAAASPATQKMHKTITNKLKEYKDKKTIIEKIDCLHEMLVLITASSSPLDKNAITELCIPLFRNLGELKKNELKALSGFFGKILVHAFQATVAQKAVIKEWIVIIEKALEVCDDSNTILMTVKTILTTPSKVSFSLLVKALFFGILLLETDVAKAELNEKLKGSLIEKIRQTLPVVYTQRAGKSIEDLEKIEQLILVSAKRPALKNVIGVSWAPTIHVLIALMTSQKETSKLAIISQYKKIAALLDPSINRYEIGLFMKDLNNFVVTRKDRALRELELFLDLLKELNSPTAKIKKALNKTDENHIATWTITLQGTVTLLQAQASTSIANQIAFLESILTGLAKNKSDYENGLLLNLLNTFFVKRGTYQSADLVIIKNFFHKIQKIPNLLAVNQIEALTRWIKEIEYAASITKEALTYCQALIIKAQESKDLQLTSKALDLLNYQQAPTVINQMVSLLNSAFNNRTQLDKSMLIDVLNKAAGLKIGTKEVFSLEQRTVLRQWISSLTK